MDDVFETSRDGRSLSEGLLSYAELMEEQSPRFSQTDPDSGQTLARWIMGANMLGTSDVLECFRCVDAVDRFDLASIPYSEATLEACAYTHLLVADLGLSVQTLRRRSYVVRMKQVFEGEAFVTRSEPATWRLIRREIPVDYFDKTSDEQRLLLPSSEQLLSARQVVYVTLLASQMLGLKLLDGQLTRTSDHDQK